MLSHYTGLPLPLHQSLLFPLIFAKEHLSLALLAPPVTPSLKKTAKKAEDGDAEKKPAAKKAAVKKAVAKTTTKKTTTKKTTKKAETTEE